MKDFSFHLQPRARPGLAAAAAAGRGGDPGVLEGWPNLSHENAIQLIYVLNAITRKAKG